MMPEIALNILDVAENSVRAGAKVVTITVEIDEAADTLGVTIADDGCGMSEEQTAHVTDPFFTTRTTRTVGLGVPFFKQAAELSGGSFSIVSRLGEGTAVHAVFGLRSIDRMPLGDVSGVIHDLVTFHPEMDVCYTYRFNGRAFTMDTRQFREVLGGLRLDTPEVSDYIAAYLRENQQETDGGAVI